MGIELLAYAAPLIVLFVFAFFLVRLRNRSTPERRRPNLKPSASEQAHQALKSRSETREDDGEAKPRQRRRS
jgi:hypothetical protein